MPSKMPKVTDTSIHCGIKAMCLHMLSVMLAQ